MCRGTCWDGAVGTSSCHRHFRGLATGRRRSATCVKNPMGGPDRKTHGCGSVGRAVNTRTLQRSSVDVCELQSVHRYAPAILSDLPIGASCVSRLSTLRTVARYEPYFLRRAFGFLPWVSVFTYMSMGPLVSALVWAPAWSPVLAVLPLLLATSYATCSSTRTACCARFMSEGSVVSLCLTVFGAELCQVHCPLRCMRTSAPMNACFAFFLALMRPAVATSPPRLLLLFSSGRFVASVLGPWCLGSWCFRLLDTWCCAWSG